MRIGAHESVSGGLHNAFDDADHDAAEAVQIFTKNASMWREPALTDEAVKTFRERARRDGGTPRPTLSHNSYLVNLAAEDETIFARSFVAMLAEVQRCAALGVDYVVFHPGSCGAPAKGESEESFAKRQDDGLTRIADALSSLHEKLGEVSTQIVLENAAGSGGCLGCSFAHLGTIIERTRVGANRLGVCVDTQHAFASGYDLRTRVGYDAMWSEFDREIGLDRLRAFHLNDSKRPLGSRVDRHDNIGKGLLGLEPFRLLVNDPRFANVPGVLETPYENDARPYGAEIAKLRSLIGRTDPIPPPAAEPLALTLSAPPAPAPAKKPAASASKPKAKPVPSKPARPTTRKR